MHPTNNISGAVQEILPQYCFSPEPVLCCFLPDWSQIKSNVTSGSRNGCMTQTAGLQRTALTVFQSKYLYCDVADIMIILNDIFG